ncbi:hypothetical protein ACTWP5_05985 [Streptomyces sp. 4N509B]|uniref:hypothetical protein n=1 Tax=Streptomyces sp. 4N509B TaxID=3457413 RepID=UPI003FD08E18
MAHSNPALADDEEPQVEAADAAPGPDLTATDDLLERARRLDDEVRRHLAAKGVTL